MSSTSSKTNDLENQLPSGNNITTNGMSPPVSQEGRPYDPAMDDAFPKRQNMDEDQQVNVSNKGTVASRFDIGRDS